MRRWRGLIVGVVKHVGELHELSMEVATFVLRRRQHGRRTLLVEGVWWWEVEESRWRGMIYGDIVRGVSKRRRKEVVEVGRGDRGRGRPETQDVGRRMMMEGGDLMAHLRQSQSHIVVATASVQLAPYAAAY